ncbi:hypothetical protein, partial [Klebsiella pneumoniae]|uniref:hypothetical protein n=1 Tax=Klebsiella pneumoniae TaxID=573 RepID=UPI0039C3ECA7
YRPFVQGAEPPKSDLTAPSQNPVLQSEPAVSGEFEYHLVLNCSAASVVPEPSALLSTLWLAIPAISLHSHIGLWARATVLKPAYINRAPQARVRRIKVMV